MEGAFKSFFIFKSPPKELEAAGFGSNKPRGIAPFSKRKSLANMYDYFIAVKVKLNATTLFDSIL